MRQYHLTAINDATGAKTYLTSYPMDHAKCCTMLSKFTPTDGLTRMLEEVAPTILHEEQAIHDSLFDVSRYKGQESQSLDDSWQSLHGCKP
jgi:hypothetical protein